MRRPIPRKYYLVGGLAAASLASLAALVIVAWKPLVEAVELGSSRHLVGSWEVLRRKDETPDIIVENPGVGVRVLSQLDGLWSVRLSWETAQIAQSPVVPFIGPVRVELRVDGDELELIGPESVLRYGFSLAENNKLLVIKSTFDSSWAELQRSSLP